VVPKDLMPLASVPVVTCAAELVQLLATGNVARIFTTSAEGTARVSVLLIRSFFAESDSRPFGLTGQEQQETICSSGVKAYTLAQIAPVVLAGLTRFAEARSAPLLPALLI